MKYTAEIFGPSWKQGPVARFTTITAARRWAGEFGHTANKCEIRRGEKLVAVHRRDPYGNGQCWYRARV